MTGPLGSFHIGFDSQVGYGGHLYCVISSPAMVSYADLRPTVLLQLYMYQSLQLGTL